MPRSLLPQPEEQRWNRASLQYSERMNDFHTWFKSEFNTLYELADGSFSKRGYSLSLYLASAQRWITYLTNHHQHEEDYFFPFFAQRMTEFAEDEEHLKSHQGIHEGLERLEKLVKKWKKEPATYSPEEMRGCLDSFRDVMMNHLDKEVEDLKGENLKKYFTLTELETYFDYLN